MAVKTKEEILESVKEIFGDNTDDGTDWKAKYTENDEAWRKLVQLVQYSGNQDTLH